MSESEWLASDNSAPILIHLRGEVSAQEQAESKGSLHGGAGRLFDGPSPFVPAARFARFATACVARARRFPLGEDDQSFFDPFAERAFGGSGTPLNAGMVCWHSACAISRAVARDSIAVTCAAATAEDWFEWGFSGGPPDPLYQATLTDEYREQARLLREIVGNPFRPIKVNEAWLRWNDGAIPKIAQTIYDDRALPSGTLDVARIGILADALEEAGCAEPQILEHCRGPGPHVRGCFVIDLLTGRG